MEKEAFEFDEVPKKFNEATQKIGTFRRVYNLFFADSPTRYCALNERKRIGLALLVGIPLSIWITNAACSYFGKPENKPQTTQECYDIGEQPPIENGRLIIPKPIAESQPCEVQETKGLAEKETPAPQPTTQNVPLEEKVTQQIPTSQNSLEETTSNYVVTCDVEQEISREGLKLIKGFENFESKPYYCPAGKLTVGYGHVFKKGEKIKEMTKKEAEEKFRDDVNIAENTLAKYVEVELSQGQYDALCSFIHNVGPEKFRKSSLLRELNKGNYEVAAKEFSEWVYANKKKLKGLENRRTKESNLFKKQ